MSTQACVVWGQDFTRYDFGAGHPMGPLRIDLTARLAQALGVLDDVEVIDVAAAPPAGRVGGDVEVIDVLEERTITELPDGTRVDHLRYGAYQVVREGLTGPVEVYPIQRRD